VEALASHLYGSILESPGLRFDYTSRIARAETPLRGLNKFGAYSKRTFPGAKIRCAFLYPDDARSGVDKFWSALHEGIERFPGFRHWFGVDIIDQSHHAVPARLQSAAEVVDAYEKGAKSILERGDCDLAFVFMRRMHRGTSYDP